MIRREVVFDASRLEVWEALTNPRSLEQWFANDVELEPDERLAFAWEDEGEVEFSLDDDGEGSTRLTVVETSPAWTTALDLQASAYALV